MRHASPTGNESLSDIRAAIDRIDQDIVELIATRQAWVAAAGKTKASASASDIAGETVDAPARVQRVIDIVRERAAAAGASADVVDATYRAMIAAFIELERGVHQSALKRRA